MCGEGDRVCCSGVETVIRVCPERKVWRLSDKSGHGLRVVRTTHGLAGQTDLETGDDTLIGFKIDTIHSLYSLRRGRWWMLKQHLMVAKQILTFVGTLEVTHALKMPSIESQE